MIAKIIFAIVVVLFLLGLINENEEATSPRESAQSSSASQSSSPTAREPTEPRPPPSPWRVNQWTSEMDDSPAVSLTTNSLGIYSGAYGGRAGPATLILRCLENTTSMYVKMNGHFLADIQGYGNVTYRVDDLQARTARMKESTDNEALGLWSGGQSIPVVRQLIGHDQVVMRITPYNQSSVSVTFPIRDLEEKIQPLREACNW